MIRSLVRVHPFGELSDVAQWFDRAFSDMGTTNGHGTVERNWSLPLDVYERDNTLFIRAAVPGIKPEDLNVSIEENILTITGEMNEEITEQDKVYRREYRYGKFSRSLTLPENIDTNGIEANFDNGFVKISLPKVEPVKPQALKIPVKFLGDAPIQEGKTDPKEA